MKKAVLFLLGLLVVVPLLAQETFKVPELTLNQKYDQTIVNLDYMVIVGVDYAKSMGKTAADYGKYLGSKAALSWDKNAGFNGFVYGSLYNLLSFQNTPELEMLVNTPDKVNLKMHLMAQWLKKQGKIMNVTYLDYMDCISNSFNAIADYLGAKCEITYDDNWMYVIISKK
jgi:hypothetical protein